MTMGEKIKLLREQNNMTLEELGNKVGVGKSTVRKWENGMIANMRRDKIAKIASALHVSPAYLMGWVDVLENSKELEFPKEESSTNPKLEEWIAFFNELSDDQQNEAMEFLRLFVGARPEARSSLVSLLKTLGS